MLLVFDEITFVDPVDDVQWRAKLFADMESYAPEFSKYQDVDVALPVLIQQGCIRQFDPSPNINGRSLATESAIRDLNDPNWLQVASTPQKYGMPSIAMSGEHSWQIFKPKLPDAFVNALRTQPEIERHLFSEGGDLNCWSLSYAAGSAIGISVHLEIAEELSLAPITDSPMHHRLMMMKMARALNVNNTVTPIADDVVRSLTVEMASTLLSQVLSEEQLQRATFEEILRFREQTAPLRKHFIRDIEMRIGQLRSVPSAPEWVASSKQVLSGLEAEFRNYEAEFTSSKMKIWPSLIRSTTSGIAAGSFVAAVGLSLIPGVHALLVGGIAGLAISAAASGFDWTAEKVKIQKSATPSVAYLSSVSKRLR